MRPRHDLVPPTAWFDGLTERQLGDVLQSVMRNVERGLSKMVGLPITISTPTVSKLSFSQVASHAGDPEEANLAVYLLISGGLQGQALLFLPQADALRLTDVILDRPPSDGPLDKHERAILGEVGNVMVSYFLNASARMMGHPEPLYPSPPLVMVDMLAAILDVVITPAAAASEELLIVSCNLYAADVHKSPDASQSGEEPIRIRFWVVPDLPNRYAAPAQAVADQFGDRNG